MNLLFDEDELRRLLEEREHLRKQVGELQARGTELLMENRALAKQYADEKIKGDGIDALVCAFHARYGHPAPEALALPGPDLVRFRVRLVTEEYLELLDAALDAPPVRPWTFEQIKKHLAWYVANAVVNADLVREQREE